MNTCFITTVGTSLLTNRDNRPWANWTTNAELPAEKIVIQWLQNADSNCASAELNTLGYLTPDDADSIIFLHSDTGEGEFCSKLLKGDAMRRFGSKCTLDKITSLDYTGGRKSAQGLRNLAALLLKYHREATQIGQIIKFCAAGGFKSEFAFTTLIGLITGCDVYHIYQQSTEPIRLPALPIGEDRRFIKQYEKFFYWIEEDIRTYEEAKSWLVNPRLADLVDEDREGNIYLNPAAHILFKYYQDDSPIPWPSESERLPREKDQISKEEHHRPKGWENLIQNLCKNPYVECVRYSAFRPGKIIDEVDEKSLCINYEKSGDTMGILVDTTADNRQQLYRIIEHIKRTILR